MQALYAYFHSQDKDQAAQEKDLFKSLENIYGLYLYLVLLLCEVRLCARNLIEVRKVKHLPTPEDLKPNTRFVNNKIISLLSVNRQLAAESKRLKVSWDKDPEIPQKIFAQILESESYKEFMASDSDSFKKQKKFLSDMVKEVIANNERLEYFFEEKNIHWADDIDFVITLLLKTIDYIPESADDSLPLAHLYKDEDEDKHFTRELFNQTISFVDEADVMIRNKTENWELERIAFMDVLLMRMAIAELLFFPTIPVKVTLNEYIELAKAYSTPKSSMFVNGILDKLIAEFRETDRMKKTGRGLVEN